ncbi:glycogen debranching N-terminal domain-containing protein [Microlunatus soli]|uniref:Glycogen debranching enzyme (Alpha-1,6-glucosidase) n=1 Tax=Microlunatus soli TaxID=630515 RepID=A0A1H1ZE65_9ACTN|nr:glycogen debranching N-terminal domain-containing protein [Microlunatus soli]SDT32008.1 Glycogen debranching enzyme (alpha-1,6-glucosidase) [Microlunatus soli]
MTPEATELQPLLHDSEILLKAPSQLWTAAGGDLGDKPIHGFYHGDTRFVRAWELRIDDAVPEPIATAPIDASRARYVSLARTVGVGDAPVRVERERTVSDGGIDEQITVINPTAESLSAAVTVRIVGDHTPMQLIRGGRAGNSIPEADGQAASMIITADGAHRSEDGLEVTLTWSVQVPADGRSDLQWSLRVQDSAAVVAGATGAPQWDSLQAVTPDSRLRRWIETALDDLAALRMTTVRTPNEPFLAAGAPWFFTLFGRDSIWAARLILSTGTEIAASTLRVLASLQGTSDVADTAEQPGKIMHELRPDILEAADGLALPPLYYGTVDATALWVILLSEAWQAGMPEDQVRALLPNLEAALQWIDEYSDADGDGFAEYIDRTGHGLANQGWKDSGDSIRWHDGRLADGPIALCEVQGYAYQAAIAGAELLDHFGTDGSGWRDWAAELKQRFADAFWIDDPAGGYPAIALDADKRRVDSVTSNMGHLLGTGILQPGQAELIARRLVSTELNSGYGLRTMSTADAGYWPLSYHCGSVWAHDTAIAINGLVAEGLVAEARVLGEGLLRAADGFGYRMPELHSGDPASQISRPVPSPAACRPQAWSAAAAVAVASAFGVQLEKSA